MIPRANITEWRSHVPWTSDAQVEQDLILSRALVELFSLSFLADNLAFRGGTAFHKLHLAPAVRYSEDIDLVQIASGPIGPIINALRNVLDPFLGNPTTRRKTNSFVVMYRMTSEIPPQVNLRLKIEINTREHFNVLGLVRWPFEVPSRWFSGKCKLTTYELDELIGTKLRALYQRRKGRDLFDLWYAVTRGNAEPRRIVEVFQEYMEASGHRVTRRMFERNLASKMQDHGFLHDTDGLLRPGVVYNAQDAFKFVENDILDSL
jgi:predicted nucleotidyltransferase component of viral defense system